MHENSSQSIWNLPGDKEVNNSPASDAGLIPGLGRSPGGGQGIPLQVLTWRIPTDRGTWGYST